MIGKLKTNASDARRDDRRVPWRPSETVWLAIVLLSGGLTSGLVEAQTRISGGQTQILANVQTGSAYTIQTSDCGKLVSFANTSPVAVTVPQAGTTIPSGCWIELQNAGAGTLTITPAVSTIDGSASVQLAAGAGMQVIASSGQYYTERGAGGAAGGGTVNSAAAGQLVYYSASGSAVSGSGCNIGGVMSSDLTCNSLTTNGSLPGEIDLYPAPGSTTYVGLAAPASAGTTYTLQLPGTAPANQLLSFGLPTSGVSAGSWINLPVSGGSGANSVYCIGSGTNTITCPGSPAPSSYLTGMTVSLLAGGTNTGSITLNIAGIGAASVLLNGVAAQAGQVVSGYSYSLYYDGTKFNFINPSIPGLQITFNTTAGTCLPSCTAAATGYGPASNLPGVTVTDNYGLPAGQTRVITGGDTSGGVAPYPEWGGASASASFRDVLNNSNSVLIPFTAAAKGTLTDALPGMGVAGAPGASGANGTNGAIGTSGTNGTNGANGTSGTNGAAGATGATGPAGPVSFLTNPQASTYQVQTSDFASCKAIPVASGTFTMTLVPSSSQPSSGQCVLILNYGSGSVTVARSGQNINGSTVSQVLAAGSASAPTGLLVISDGTNYEAQPLGGTGSGSSGGATGATGATGPAGPVSFVANPQAAAYQAVSSDFASCKSIPVSSGTFTITLVASVSQPASGQCILILNYGSGVVTAAPSGQNINGAGSSMTLAAGSSSSPTGLLVISDGTNYEAQPLGASSGGSSLSTTASVDLGVLGSCNVGVGTTLGWSWNGTNYSPGYCSISSGSAFFAVILNQGTNSGMVRWFTLPYDWDGNNDLYITGVALEDAGGDTGNFGIKVGFACTIANALTQTFLTYASTGAIAVTGTAKAAHVLTAGPITSTGCTAGGMMAISLLRDNSVASNTSGQIDVIGNLQLKYVRH